MFVKSPQAKERLQPALDAGNVKQTMAAPVTAIVAYDLEFYEKLPQLAPHTDARSWFVGTSAEHIRTTALRNGSLQGAYLIVAARALGLDCGPMSRIRQREGGRGLFRRDHDPLEFPVQPRLRRCRKAAPARSPAVVRRGLLDRQSIRS